MQIKPSPSEGELRTALARLSVRGGLQPAFTVVLIALMAGESGRGLPHSRTLRAVRMPRAIRLFAVGSHVLLVEKNLSIRHPIAPLEQGGRICPAGGSLRQLVECGSPQPLSPATQVVMKKGSVACKSNPPQVRGNYSLR